MQPDGNGYAVISCPTCGAPLHGESDTLICGYCATQVSKPAAPAGGAGHPGGPASAAIEALRFKGQSLPPGWIELQFLYATAAQCEQFGQSFHSRLAAVGNQIMNAHAKRLQVNYLDAHSPDGAKTVYGAMVKLVGKSNAVARTGALVVEIICADSGTISTVLEALKPEESHRPHHGRW